MISEIIEIDGSEESLDKVQELIDKANSFYDDRRFELELIKEEDKVPHFLADFWLLTHLDDYMDEGPDTWSASGQFGRLIYLDIKKGEMHLMHKESIAYKEFEKMKKHFG